MITINMLTKTLLVMLLVASIALAGMFYQWYLLGKKQPEIIEKTLVKTSQLLVSEIDNWVDKNFRIAIMLTNMAGVKAMDPVKQVPALIAATEALEWASIIFIADTNGDAIARSDGKRLRNYSDRDYVKQILSGKDIGQQVLIGKAKPIPLQCFAVPIKNPDLVGLLTQCSILTDIAKIVIDQRIGSTGIAFLVDGEDRLIAHGNVKELTAKLQDFSGHPALREAADQSVNIIEVDGVERVFVVSHVGLDWKLVVQQDYTEAYSDYLEIKQLFQYIIMATIVLILIVAFLYSVHVSRPIKQLTNVANNFSKGHFGDPVEYTERKDEFGELAKSIERIGVSIRLALKRLKSSSGE